MLSKWLSYQTRNLPGHKFAVVDVSETQSVDDEILAHLGSAIVVAHQSPTMTRAECEILRQDAEELDLETLKQYIEEEVLPAADKILTRVGNFGEILAAGLLVEFENFWLPIYKLRFREKRDWAMRLTDLCLIKKDGLPRPLVCYGEAKTRSSRCDLNLAVDGHASLAKDDALSDPEILRFICTWLYETGMYEEASLLSKIRLRRLEYDTRHDLFLIHDSGRWDERILDNLDACDLDARLVDFSVKVVLVSQLRDVIDVAYDQASQSARELVNG